MKVKVKIPTSLQDITLGQYQDYLQYMSDFNEETGNIVDLQKDLISSICLIDRELVGKMKASMVMEATSLIMNIMNEVKNPQPLISTFKLGEIEYGFIPNLEDASFDEWTDLDSYLKHPDDYHILMAVLYRPVTVKKRRGYDIEEYDVTDGREDIMKAAPLSYFIGAYSFFASLGTTLLEVIPSCLEKLTASSEVKESLKTWQQDMAGIGHIINYPTEIQLKYEKLVSSTLEKH